ncbi:MAG: LysM peptidoglycan-binding domain-containing protein [Desulfobacteraceae bacterium]
MKSYVVSVARKGVYGLSLLVIFTGCAYVGEKLDTLRKADYYEHTVQWPGESLSVIAKWYTGNLENWKAIAQANPELDPRRITIGTKVRIPENLIKNKEPMPKDFVASFGREPEKGPPTPKPKPPHKAAFYEHTVQWPGESLSIIAKWYTGRFDNWKALAEANPELDPRRITIGTKIRIPENLLKNKEPMPKDFVASFYTKPEKAPPQHEPEALGQPREEKPELFGPKGYPGQ